GRLRDETVSVEGSGTAADFSSLVDQAVKGTSLHWHSIGRGGLGPSDHMSFATKRIPVLFLFTGLHADYHRPTDVASKINYQGMAEVVEFGRHLIDELCVMPRESYVTAADADS